MAGELAGDFFNSAGKQTPEKQKRPPAAVFFVYSSVSSSACRVVARFTSLASAFGESSLIPRLLLSPPDPLRWAPAGAPETAAGALSFSYSSVSSSACQRFIFASLGIRQSPRGDRATEPTLGPSGTLLRLNCGEKKRR